LLSVGIYPPGKGNGPAFLIVGLSVALFPLYCVLVIGRIRYIFEKDGIRLPGTAWAVGFRLGEFIPYSSVTRFYKTRAVFEVIFGASFDVVIITYMNENGKRESVTLSPEDRDRFASELTRRTGVPLSADPHKKTK
jgi:hypothetical protein